MLIFSISKTLSANHFSRDLYAIVNDLPNIVVIGHEGDEEKREYISYANSESPTESRSGDGGLLNANKINLVAIVLDNLELFHRHSRSMIKLLEQRSNKNNQNVDVRDGKGYEPVQTIHGLCHGVQFIPLNTVNFDLDVIQRLQHGTTVK
ncbi:Phospholipase C [Parelaphostrongylus tenuis]|uniref:Phospholipase C n=1 Tax=Parelaphostrongylus tenuis TaxID=148309 RepID=A0AAD5MHY2_PARTN|nr:Phospholipase C [Parelaphostrongylus tenuis]